MHLKFPVESYMFQYNFLVALKFQYRILHFQYQILQDSKSDFLQLALPLTLCCSKTHRIAQIPIVLSLCQKICSKFKITDYAIIIVFFFLILIAINE